MFHQIMFFYVFSIEHPGDIFIYDTKKRKGVSGYMQYAPLRSAD